MTNRELNAAIAEALGWQRWEPFADQARTKPQTEWFAPGAKYPTTLLPAYHADPAAADALMRALRERGWDVGVRINVHGAAASVVHRFDAIADTWTEALAHAALSALTAGKP